MASDQVQNGRRDLSTARNAGFDLVRVIFGFRADAPQVNSSAALAAAPSRVRGLGAGYRHRPEAPSPSVPRDRQELAGGGSFAQLFCL
jgi:hypothetical protein